MIDPLPRIQRSIFEGKKFLTFLYSTKSTDCHTWHENEGEGGHNLKIVADQQKNFEKNC